MAGPSRLLRLPVQHPDFGLNTPRLLSATDQIGSCVGLARLVLCVQRTDILQFWGSKPRFRAFADARFLGRHGHVRRRTQAQRPVPMARLEPRPCWQLSLPCRALGGSARCARRVDLAGFLALIFCLEGDTACLGSLMTHKRLPPHGSAGVCLVRLGSAWLGGRLLVVFP